MKILVTGPTGFLGKNLIRHLLREGHEVRALARPPAKVTSLPAENIFPWPAPAAALAGAEAVVHLAGEPIAGGRWTPERKQRLFDSRVLGTRNLLRGLAAVEPALRPRTLVSASAIGYYGDTGEAEVTEEAPPAPDFLGKLCREWEDAAMEARGLGVRTVLLRTGIVLAGEGGALGKMGPVVLGSGRQWMSWIHLHDWIRFVSFALSHPEVTGPYNLVSPEPVRNAEFTRALAKARRFPLVVPAPAFALRLALGELATVLLASQRVTPANALRAGFSFTYPRLAGALGEIYATG